MVVADKKKELIVEGAIKRFSHFGVNKTSMAEIADDLSLSKPALYYYFPDKLSLITEVADKISSTYLDNVETTFLKTGSLEAALMELIEIRKNFFQKYFMLHMEEDYSDAYLKDPALVKLMQGIKEREVKIIAQGFQTSISSGELGEIDPVKTTELLLDTLRGLSSCMRSEKMILPDSATLEQVYRKQKEVAVIFLKGLKKHS
jgi:TetR/AcrR family transcriptional repressor of mexJK operon